MLKLFSTDRKKHQLASSNGDIYSASGLIISDLHVGSKAGVMPAGFISSNEDIIDLNKAQLYLNKCLEDMLSIIPENMDFLIVNGDAVHGNNKKEIALGVCEPNMSYQVEAAQRALQPFADCASNVFYTSGSGYHVGDGGVWSNTLARSLGAKRSPDGSYAPYWWHINIDGVNIDLAHTQSVMMRYPATSLQREIQFSTMVADLMEFGQADIIIRSHIHRCVVINVDGRIGVSTPAMCCQTPYAKRSKVPNRYLSRYIGAMFIKIRKEKYSKRCQRIEIEPILYKHPKIEAIKI